MELTFLMTFCRGGNLKTVWSILGLDKSVDTIKALIHDHFGSEFHGTLLSDLKAIGASSQSQDAQLHSDEPFMQLDDSTYRALATRLNAEPGTIHYRTDSSDITNGSHISPDVQFLQKITLKGTMFSTSRSSLNNSLVNFCCAPGGTFRAGRIASIFLHTRSGPGGTTVREHFISVIAFQQLSAEEAKTDPYLKYPLLDVRLYHDNLVQETTVVKADDIISHIATCPVQVDSKKYCIAISLDRVSWWASQLIFNC